MAIIIRRAGADELDALNALWLRSVRATHTFLTEDDILFYAPLVAEALTSDLELWAIFDHGDGGPAGFMALGAPDDFSKKWKLEALFIDPDKIRRGFGKCLVEHALAVKGPLILDVNEQNPDARAFYRRLGFTETGRSYKDGAGKPFPLIHMEMF